MEDNFRRKTISSWKIQSNFGRPLNDDGTGDEEGGVGGVGSSIVIPALVTTSGGRHFRKVRLFFSTLSCCRVSALFTNTRQTDSEDLRPLRHDKILFLKMATVYQHVWTSAQVQACRIRKYGLFWDLMPIRFANIK